MPDDAVLSIGGNYSVKYADDVHENNGTIIFNGTQSQEVYHLNTKNVIITNPAGIVYMSNVIISGIFDTNRIPINNNDYYTVLRSLPPVHDGNYGKIIISGEIEFSGNYTADFVISSALIIPENEQLNITGSVSISSSSYGYGKLYNYGNLSISGDIDIKGSDNANVKVENYHTLHIGGSMECGSLDNYGDICIGDNVTVMYLYMPDESATVSIGGDFSRKSDVCYKGTFVFKGKEPQKVETKLHCEKIIIENNNGIYFNSAIYVSTLFNHNGNNFTLYRSSAFVDYDGDGMKDNVDPEPTVGNPCTLYFTSEDTEKGSVSLSEVETIGGTKITVTATPTFKYDFSKWVNSAGTTVSTSAECTIVATGDETYIAVFTKRQQPITTQTDGGTINAPAKAEIESEVTVSVTENDGYVYTDGSLSYNGIPVENGSFIMPDEAVTLTAEFVRNENYFALNDVLTAAKSYTYQSYSKESFANLTDAINVAQTALVNNITAEESAAQTALLQAAIDGLEEKFISSVTLKTTPTLYINVPDMINDISVLVTYDNGTTLTVTGTDCTIEGYDASVLGEQSITITYGEVTGTASVTVQKRILDECTVSEIVDQIYDGVKEEYTTAPVVSYNRTNEILTENTDYTIEYFNNTAVGEATITITGIGNYAGSISLPFNIYCEHNYECIGQVDASCTQTGYQTEKCTICDKTNAYENIVTEGLPESEHNYANKCDVSYYYTDDGASSLVLVFSSSTLTETNCDKIYIYDEADTLLGTYSGSSLAGKSITVSGDTVRIRLTSDGSVVKYGFSLDSITSYFDYLLIPTTDHSYGEWSTVTAATPDTVGTKHKLCTVCGDEVTEDIPVVEGLAFKGASLTLYSDLAINYKVDKSLFEEVGYTDPYVIFKLGDTDKKVTKYTVSDGKYIFDFEDIAPNQIGDIIYATLYASYNGVEYASETKEYSVATYCYNMLSKYSTDDYAELRTLLVDLLNYGAQTQIYTGYNTDSLTNASLTDTQKGYATVDKPKYTNVFDIDYETIDAPTVQWKGCGLNLQSAVTLRFKLATEETSGLTVKVKSESGRTWTLRQKTFEVIDGGYYVYFSGLDASQMSETIYLTVYQDGAAVSNTLRYSVESYAYSKQNTQDENLSTLLESMMKYGNSAKSFNS